MQLQKEVIFVTIFACVIIGVKVLLDDSHISSTRELLLDGAPVRGDSAAESRHAGPGGGGGDLRGAGEPVQPGRNRTALVPTPASADTAGEPPLGDTHRLGGSDSADDTTRLLAELFPVESAPIVEHNFRDLPADFYRLAPDIFDEVPERFLEEFRNPCWRAPSTGGLQPTPGGDAAVYRCLPYFFLAGMPKCGTSDLNAKLHKHPQMALTKKEPHWWTRKRFHDGVKFQTYLRQQSADISQRLHRVSGRNSVIGDSSASTFWDNGAWRNLSNVTNHRISEILRTILPDVKIIVILRNPVERMYSDFNYFRPRDYHTGPSVFHNLVATAIRKFEVCLQNTSDNHRDCTYCMQQKYGRRLSIGMYSVYLRDWLKVFPRDQIRVLRLEDWRYYCTSILPELFDFLQLRTLPKATIEKICVGPARNVNRATRKPMGLDTRRMLTDFYRFSNVDLAQLLGDDRYLWNDLTKAV